MITQTLLLSLLDYDPETGIVVRKARPLSDFSTPQSHGRWKNQVGKPIISLDTHGYLGIAIYGKRYLLHRLIWVMVTGKWPIHDIDHRNRVKTDNSLINLRDTKYNTRNVGTTKANTSGTTGVYWIYNKWEAKIGGKSLGAFYDKQDAIKARKLAEQQLGYGE